MNLRAQLDLQQLFIVIVKFLLRFIDKQKMNDNLNRYKQGIRRIQLSK